MRGQQVPVMAPMPSSVEARASGVEFMNVSSPDRLQVLYKWQLCTELLNVVESFAGAANDQVWGRPERLA